MVGRRWRFLGAAALCGVALAGCGKATAPTTGGAAGTPRHTAPKLNPAETAAFEIVRLQSIVPFSQAQVQKLEPMLEALIKNPNQSASAIAADAKQITSEFTSTQQTAIKNAGLGSVTAAGGAGGFGGRGFAGGGHFSGTRPRFSGVRPGSNGGSFRRRFSGTGNGKPPALRGSFAYTLALDTLEGKRPTFPGRPGGAAAPGGGSPATSGTPQGGAPATSGSSGGTTVTA